MDGVLAAAGTALLDGSAQVENPLGFPLPPLPPVTGEVRHTITITDRIESPTRAHSAPDSRALTPRLAGTRLVPPTLVVGIGSARGVSADAVLATLRRLETEHGLDLRAVRAYASLDLKADEAGILAAVAPAELLTLSLIHI